MFKALRKMVPLMLTAALVFAACAQPAADTAAPAQPPAQAQAGNVPDGAAGDAAVGGAGGELNVGIIGAPFDIASWTSNDLNASMITNIAFPRLMDIDETGMKVPFIVRDYSISDCGTQFTVEIHDGIYWHDGTPFTTADLYFTARYTVENVLGHGADMFAGVDTMEIVSDTVIIYNLRAPAVNFLTQMGYWIQTIPKHIYENVEDPFAFDHPAIGFGPFKIDSFTRGVYYSFVRVPNWPLANNGEGALLDRVTFRVYQDANALTLALRNGEIDASASTLPVASQRQLLNDPDRFSVLSAPSLGFGYFGFSYRNPNLAIPEMRRAIAHTIDRDALVDVALQGGAIKMYHPISPVFPELIASDIRFPAFDIDEANRILDEAGFLDVDGDGYREDQNGNPMSFNIVYRTTTINVDAIVSIFRDNAALAGIRIVLNPMEHAAYTERVVQNRDFDINVIDWGVIDDPDSSLATIYLSTAQLNFMEFYNPAMDALLIASSQEPSFERRVEIMDEFQKLFVEELPTVNTWVRINAFGVSNDFGGWNLIPGVHGIMNARELVQVYRR